jgi:hypothetical protein
LKAIKKYKNSLVETAFPQEENPILKEDYIEEAKCEESKSSED